LSKVKQLQYAGPAQNNTKCHFLFFLLSINVLSFPFDKQPMAVVTLVALLLTSLAWLAQTPTLVGASGLVSGTGSSTTFPIFNDIVMSYRVSSPENPVS
jgi:hypothetical protein